jgi:hypothetical protein
LRPERWKPIGRSVPGWQLQSQFYDLVLHLYEKSEIPSIFFVGFQNTLLRGETDSPDDSPYDLQMPDEREYFFEYQKGARTGMLARKLVDQQLVLLVTPAVRLRD